MIVHIIQPCLPRYRIPLFRLLRSRLTELGHRLIIYAAPGEHLGFKSFSENEPDTFIYGSIKEFLFGKLLWQTGLKINIKRGDVVILSGNTRLISNYFIWACAKFAGASVIWWGHGWSAGRRGTLAIKIRQAIMKLADVIILYTDQERDAYIKLGFKEDSIFSLNNGLDIEEIDNARKLVDSVKIKRILDNFKLSISNKHIIFIGRITEKARIFDLINSMKHVNKNIHLIIIGDGPERKNAENLAKILGVDNCISWVGSLDDESDIAPFMAISSLFVYPGPVGLSLIHAFSYGLPCIVHQDSDLHMPEIAAFEEGYNGATFEFGSFVSLAHSINELIEDDDKIIKLAKNAFDTVRNDFNINNMTDRYIEAIRYSMELNT